MRYKRELREIKEEDVMFEAKHYVFEGDRGALEGVSQQERDDVISDRQRRAKLASRKKFKGRLGRI